MMPISAEPNWYPNKVIFKSKIYLTQGPDFHSKKKKKKKVRKRLNGILYWKTKILDIFKLKYMRKSCFILCLSEKPQLHLLAKSQNEQTVIECSFVGLFVLHVSSLISCLVFIEQSYKGSFL